MSQKTYTESEISAILGRAARLQASRVTSKHEKLTLAEIKDAAAEAGIDEGYVDLAASASSDHHYSYMSIPTGIGRSLFVRGSLTDKAWNQMVAIFSREFGRPGKTKTSDGQRSWSLDSLCITAEEINGQIALHAKTEWGNELEVPIALSLVGGIAAMMMGAIALISQEWTIGIVAAIFAVLVIGLFSIFRRRTSQKQERLRAKFEAVFDRSSEIIYPMGAKNVDEGIAETNNIRLPEADNKEAPHTSTGQHQNIR